MNNKQSKYTKTKRKISKIADKEKTKSKKEKHEETRNKEVRN